MSNLGWERIWNSEHGPERFGSFASPDDTVVDWANNLSPGASVLDEGCGVAATLSIWVSAAFEWLARTSRRVVCSAPILPVPSVTSPLTVGGVP